MEKKYGRNRRDYRPRGNDGRGNYRDNGGDGQRRTSYRDWGGMDFKRDGDFNPGNGRGERPGYGDRGFRKDYGRERYSDSKAGKEEYGRRTGYGDRGFRKEYGRERYSDSKAGKEEYGRRSGYGDCGFRKEYGRERYSDSKAGKEEYGRRTGYGDRGFRKEYGRERYSDSKAGKERFGKEKFGKEKLGKSRYSREKVVSRHRKSEEESEEIRLNRFISMGGVCSRREADQLIVEGRVKVNGDVIQTVGQKVKRTDMVEVDGVQVIPEKKIYIVLNKPKDYVTTVDDPMERKTVMSLVEGACKERIYPVGRLDRQTTGVLLFTNDGELAKKLTHPKYNYKKIYHVFLDKPLNENDFEAIAAGVELEDGFVKVDEMNYASPDLKEVGIEIHSGKNRIVRRIFEHFGYQIEKLDRVYFAGITKKNVPRGKWRFLTPSEVNMLKVY